MHNFKLLDCTLRDGGYVNDWNFGHNTLLDIYKRITSAEVDFIEVGFLDDRRPFDINRSITPTTECLKQIYQNPSSTKTEAVAMIDYGTCAISNIQPCSETIIDGIRVIFKKHLRVQAVDFCRQLKELGYKVFTQAVSITSYNDDELLDLIRLVNDVEPYALSMVDTYGLLNKDSLLHYYELIDNNLSENVGIGYHAHNNFQLAFSNCMELMKCHGDKERMLLVDGSCYGMGKSAGNAPTELLTMFMNDHYGKTYDINQLLEVIDVNLLDIYRLTPWGYNFQFFLAASNDCHPNYVTYLLHKKTLSVKSINDILDSIESDKKLLYDKNYIEQLYIDYQKNECDDVTSYQNLKNSLEGKDVLVIGPGKNIIVEKHRISKYIADYKPIVIAINFIPVDWRPNYLFITNSKRYVQQAASISQNEGAIKFIATSNVTKSNGKFDFVLDYESLIDRDAVFMDNSFIMLLKVLIKSSVKHIELAGLDGYSTNGESNYFSSKMEYDYAKQKGEEINAYVNKTLKEIKNQISLEFLTQTVYEI